MKSNTIMLFATALCTQHAGLPHKCLCHGVHPWGVSAWGPGVLGSGGSRGGTLGHPRVARITFFAFILRYSCGSRPGVLLVAKDRPRVYFSIHV